ncbi:putative enoyl-CoA delta isomerase 1, peroxisomal-like [Sesbania bispinosa]|nr:putative enoyl-CoA delta isomerase 1, peroxisomal-like [Sesbania bispinosa]
MATSLQPILCQSTQDCVLLMDDLLHSIVSLPMPILVAFTCHASVAGYSHAFAHDYLLKRNDKGFLNLRELDINHVILAWFVSLIDAKVGSSMARRRIVMRAAKCCR